MQKRSGYLGFFLFALTCSFETEGQNFIGLHKSEIAGLLKTINPQFKLDNNAVNHTYNYLKFVDKISEQTILFFLSDSDVCTYVRWMADYANLHDLTGMLNQNYHKQGPNAWLYKDKGCNYKVTLEEEEWYFTISFRKN
jgi:hypothetical protein